MAGKLADCIYFKWKRASERKRSISWMEVNSPNPASCLPGWRWEGRAWELSAASSFHAPHLPFNPGTHLRRRQRERLLQACLGTVHWRQVVRKLILTQTERAFEEEKRNELRRKGLGQMPPGWCRELWMHIDSEWSSYLWMNELTWGRGVLWIVTTIQCDRLPHWRKISLLLDSQSLGEFLPSFLNSLNLMVVLLCLLNFCELKTRASLASKI